VGKPVALAPDDARSDCGISSVIPDMPLGVVLSDLSRVSGFIGTNVIVPSLMMDRALRAVNPTLVDAEAIRTERLRFKMLLLLPMEMVVVWVAALQVQIHLLLWQKSSKSTMTKAAISLLLKFRGSRGDSGTKPQ